MNTGNHPVYSGVLNQENNDRHSTLLLQVFVDSFVRLYKFHYSQGRHCKFGRHMASKGAVNGTGRLGRGGR